LLLCTFVLIILMVSGFIGYTAHRHSYRTVHEMALLLQREIANRITEHVLAFLDTPHRINGLNAKVLGNGEIPPDEPRSLERRFWRQVATFPSVSSIYFGNVNGGLVNSGREADGNSLYVIFTEANKAGTFFKFSVDDGGGRTVKTAEVPSFDARVRGWYTGALAKEKSTWSDIYILFTGQDMALAASRPVFGEDGSLLGVVSVDVFLSHIARFLRTLKIASAGEAFIMERSGHLVAFSDDEPAFIPAQGDRPARRVHVRESGNTLIRMTGGLLEEILGNGTSLDSVFQSNFRKNGENYLLHVSPLRDPHGIDWLLAIVVPESDFTAILQEGNRNALVLIALVLAFSALLAAFAARKITVPILRLNNAVSILARGERPGRMGIPSAIIEVRDLARSFNHMAVRLHRTIRGLNDEIEHRRLTEAALRESEMKMRVQAARDFLTGLPNRRTFIKRMEEEMARIRRFRTACSMLMLDIDHFKQVNDRYGHGGGDNVLKAFAAVLQETIRQTDSSGRLGGEEFGVLLTGTAPSEALVLAERIMEKIRKIRVETPSGPISFTASIGVAPITPEDDSVDIPLMRADEALYRAKTKGRDRVEE